MDPYDTGDFASKRALAVYSFPFTPSIPNLDHRFSTNTGRFIPKDMELDNFIPGTIPDIPMNDALGKLLVKRSTILSKVPEPDSFFPEVYGRGSIGYVAPSVPGKVKTPAMRVLFSDQFIQDSIKRIQLSLFKILKLVPGGFVPPQVHRGDVVAFLEDEYQNVGIIYDTSATDPSKENIRRIVFTVAKPALDRIIYRGYRFLQDRSKFMYQMAGPYVMSHGEDESIRGTRETIGDDTLGFREQIIIEPDSMETPYWWV